MCNCKKSKNVTTHKMINQENKGDDNVKRIFTASPNDYSVKEVNGTLIVSKR